MADSRGIDRAAAPFLCRPGNQLDQNAWYFDF